MKPVGDRICCLRVRACKMKRHLERRDVEHRKHLTMVSGCCQFAAAVHSTTTGKTFEIGCSIASLSDGSNGMILPLCSNGLVVFDVSDVLSLMSC